MQQSILGKTDLSVSLVGFGALPIGPWQMNLPVDQGADVLRYGLEKGINFLDTAQYYKTYPYIKKALSGWDKELVICSKSLDTGYQEMDFAIEEARQEMDRDVIDIFLMHEVGTGHDWSNRAPAWECLQDAKAKGRIKAVGISTHHVDVADFAAAIPELDLLFPLINITGIGIRKHNGAGTPEEMAAAIQKAHTAGKGVFAMKVFGGGNITGRLQEAFTYVRNLPGVDSMMIGFGYKHEIDEIIDLAEGRLSPDFVPTINHKKVRIDHGDCTGCQACIKRCPNNALYLNEDGLAGVDHGICLTCGYCAPQCPYMAILLY